VILVLGDYRARRADLVDRLTEVITGCPEFRGIEEDTLSEMCSSLIGMCLSEVGLNSELGLDKQS
jgi:hypothetical protein